MVDVTDAEYSTINACSSSDLPLLSEIYTHENGSEFLGTTRLYLDKTQRFTIQGYEVDLACNLGPDTVSAYGYFEISDDKAIAAAAEEPRGQGFSAVAELAKPGRRTFNVFEIENPRCSAHFVKGSIAQNAHAGREY